MTLFHVYHYFVFQMADQIRNGVLAFLKVMKLPILWVLQLNFRKIKESTNGYSHLTEDEIVKTPFIANIYGFVEILEWLPKFVEVNYKNYI